MKKSAKADVAFMRQETQFTCCAASIASALKAHGKDITEAGLNKVLKASPMGGATWEAMLATVQYFGLRGTLVVPSTLSQLKGWTDAGIPVIIAWNPEGRPWSHASCVFDVDENHNVHIMDPNIPDPNETIRVVPKSEFYKKWSEAIGDNLIVRRPALAIEREITKDGRQVMASKIAEAYDCYKDYKAGGLSWEEYQDCLRRFGDEEDEPRPGHQYPARPPVSQVSQTPEERHQIERALIALNTDPTPDRKEMKFLYDILYKGTISEKQKSWRDRILTKHSHRIREVPADMRISAFSGMSGTPWYFGEARDPDHVAFVEKYFEGWKEKEGSIAPGYVRSKPLTPLPASNIEADRRLEILDTLIQKRPGDGFLKSIREQVARGRPLSEAQLKAIRQNLYRNSMRSEADHFRMASSITTRFLAKIGKSFPEIWAVGEPKESSELEDIWFNAGDFIQSQFKDYGKLLFFSDRAEARTEAEKRLKKRDQ